MERALESPEECDVLVIGGGPAGSTVSTLLRRKGWRVTLVEKDSHPRFHIGESLLPRNLPIFDELGVMNEIRQIGVVKRGADFSLPASGKHILFDFSNALDPTPPTAFQVKRAEFDNVLFRNAGRAGVATHEGVKATAITFTDDDHVLVDARESDGAIRRWRARFLVDASGRDAFLANRFNLKVKNPRHESAALFAHFDNVDRRSAEEAGNISVYWFEHGWFWMIPLRDGRMSVGAVCRPAYLKSRKVPVKDFFFSTIALCPPLAERMSKASVATEIMTTGNFSYYSKRMFGRNYLLVGDAYAFIDPVFSTGVFLAMSGARSAADTIDKYLGNPRLSRPLLWLHRRRVLRWLRTYSWFIYRFTSPAMKRLFMNPSNRFGLKSAVISVLSGDHTPTMGLSLRITVFKVVYYAFDMLAWRQSQQWRREVQVAL